MLIESLCAVRRLRSAYKRCQSGRGFRLFKSAGRGVGFPYLFRLERPLGAYKDASSTFGHITSAETFFKIPYGEKQVHVVRDSQYTRLADCSVLIDIHYIQSQI